MDLPDPADLNALDLSDLDQEQEEPPTCCAIVPVTPTLTRDCGKPAPHIYSLTLPHGLEILYALCDEHAP